MGKTMVLRSLRSIYCRRYLGLSSPATVHDLYLNHSPLPSLSPSRIPSGSQPSFTMGIEGTRHFSAQGPYFNFGSLISESRSENGPQVLAIRDLEIRRAFKDLMATSWDEIPPDVVENVKTVLEQFTDDTAGQEALQNTLETAQVVEKFNKILISKVKEVDDGSGILKQMSEESITTLRFVNKIYSAYLKGFGPEKSEMKKKVEGVLRSKLDFLMKCSGHDK